MCHSEVLNLRINQIHAVRIATVMNFYRKKVSNLVLQHRTKTIITSAIYCTECSSYLLPPLFCCYLTVNRCRSLFALSHEGRLKSDPSLLSDWTFAMVVGEMKRRKSGRIRRLSSGFKADITHSLCCSTNVSLAYA